MTWSSARLIHPFSGTSASCVACTLQRLAGAAVDLGDESGSGNREGVADQPRQPFVVLVLQRRLARFDELEVGRHELGLSPARRIAAHQRVEVILELADLVDRPFLRQGGEGVGGRAGAVIVERRRLVRMRATAPTLASLISGSSGVSDHGTLYLMNISSTSSMKDGLDRTST